MSSTRKSVKLNNKGRNVRSNHHLPKDKSEDLLRIAPPKPKIENVASFSSSNSTSSSGSSGLVFSVHPVWPDLPQNQSKLFFECTLFLYSVLALFLQYLNLYKTLWWLPKSHWHSSMKFYLINPYLLSCIGLLLGMRVTICFWNTVSERSAYFLKGCKGWKLKTFSLMEFSIRFFLLSTVLSSFLFSFSRIFIEFGVKTLLYFGYPVCFYVLFFHRHFFNSIYQLIFGSDHSFLSSKFWSAVWTSFKQIFCTNLIDLDYVVHLCSNVPARNREEAKILLSDFDIRFKACMFTGIFTAYFSVLMPRVFIPEKSASGSLQYVLIDDFWVLQMFVIIALTGFLLYATYLFPIQYFDLMHRCATHLGFWRRLRHSRPLEDSALEFDEGLDTPLQNNCIVSFRGEYFHAQAFSEVKTVAAIPGNEDHVRLYKIAADPVQLVAYVFLFQFVLILAQFWALILSTEWQKIVTLVLLMFANYLLLAKVFKDRVIIGRIYKPSSEDLYLISQLKSEMNQFVQCSLGQRHISNQQLQHDNHHHNQKVKGHGTKAS